MGETRPCQPHRARLFPARAGGDDSTHPAGSAVNASQVKSATKVPDLTSGSGWCWRMLNNLELHLVVDSYATHKTRPGTRGCSTMATATGTSQSAASRIWRAFGLKPHAVETWKLSTDPRSWTRRAPPDEGGPHSAHLTVCGPRGCEGQALPVKAARVKATGSPETSQSPSPPACGPMAARREPGRARYRTKLLASRALPLADRWSGGQAGDEIDQIAGHPLRRPPKHRGTRWL